MSSSLDPLTPISPTPLGNTTVIVDPGGGGGGPVDESNLMHKSFDETVTGRKSFLSATGGLFTDFRRGVPGVQVYDNDPPSPSWLDSVTGEPFTYSDSSAVTGLSPIPMMVKFTTTSSLANTITWGNQMYPEAAEAYGRFYFYLDQNLTANNRFVRQASVFQIKLNFSTKKIELLDHGNTVEATSTTVIGATTLYRVEWHAVCGTPGTVTVKLFAAHATNPLETITASWNTSASSLVSCEFGNTGGANHGGKILRIAALVAGGTGWPGPYTGRPNVFEVADPLDTTKPELEVADSGDIIIRTQRPFNIADGGTGHYLYQRGDRVGLINGRGIFLGALYGVKDPFRVSDSDNHDISIDVMNRRCSFRGMNVRNLNDPPDIAFNRLMLPSDPLNGQFGDVGYSATWTAGSTAVTFVASDLTLTLGERGHGLHLGGTIDGVDGTEVNVAEITAANTCTVTPAPSTSSVATTATGVNVLNSATVNCGSTTGFAAPPNSTTATGVNALNSTTINCGSTTGFPSYGTAYLSGVAFTYAAKTGTSFTGCGNHAATTGGEVIVSSMPQAYLAGAAFTYTGLTATAFTGCGSHAATVGGEAIAQGIWKLKTFPYPRALTGSASGLTSGQLRWNPHSFPFIRSAAGGMNTTSASNIVTVAGFTSADIGRRLLISRTTALTPRTPGSSGIDPTLNSNGDSFVITNVVGSTVYLNADVLATLTNVGYIIAGSEADGGGKKGSIILWTISGDANRNIIECDNSGTLMHGGAKLSFQALNPNIANSVASPDTRAVASFDADGSVNFDYGNVDAAGFEVAGTALASTHLSDTNSLRRANQYRSIIPVVSCRANASNVTGAGTFSLGSGGAALFSTASINLSAIYLASGDYVATGLTTKLRVHSGIMVNDTAPGTTFVVGLYPVGTPAGGLNVLNPTVGTVLAGSTVTFTTPAANSSPVPSTSGDFAFPSNGWYVLAFTTSGAMTANSRVDFFTRLEVRNV